MSQILVLGPPGCGKTTNLLGKMEECLASGIAPNRIAFVSFTRKAVLEAASRAKSKFSLQDTDLPFFKTIHSLCFSLLDVKRDDMMGLANYRELGEMLGYRFDGTFDESETGMPQGVKEGDKLLFLDNFSRVSMLPFKRTWEIANADVDWFAFERFTEALANYKKTNGLLDFTDLLTNVVDRVFNVDVDVVFIDEAQDLSKLQWAVIKAVFVNAPRIFIAGDDDQSIYKWSGADVDTFLNLKGKKELLTQSYRLPRAIYNLSAQIIARVGARYEKAYKPRDANGSMTVALNIDQVEFNPDETTLCLARNVYLLDKFYAALKANGISYMGRGGHASVKRGHIEAILAWEALRAGKPITGRAAKYVYEQMRIGPYLKRGAKTSIAAVNDKSMFTAKTLKENHGLLKIDIWHDALDNIEIEQREYYLTILRKGRRLQDTPKVLVSTIHGVKGGEADHVVLLTDMSYRTWDESRRDPDSEHRVSYVAVTRSKERLTIVQPSSSFSYSY